MRTPTLGTAFYVPTPPPDDQKQWSRWQHEENIKISAAITALSLGRLDTTTVAPAKPRDGDYRMCDGTSWNPVALGQRFVGYRGGVWRDLG